MNILLSSILFPLQVDVTNLWKKKAETDNSALVFIIMIVVVITSLIIINVIRKKIPTEVRKKTVSVHSAPRVYSFFAFSRLARNIGLNHEQKKMLEYVFRIDGATDPEKSSKTPDLLDRHFRHAFRVIEQSANTEEEAQNKLAVLFSVRNILENNIGAELYSTRQFPEETSIVINAGKEKYHAMVISAKREHLIIEIPPNALGNAVKIPKGNTLNIMAFTKNNKGYTFATRIVGYSGKSEILLAHSNHIRFLSQRRFRRRQSAISCNMFFVNLEGSGKKQRLVLDKRRLLGNICDISVGGCSIKSTNPIQGGARLKIEFTQVNYLVAALGQVLRTNRAGTNTIMHIKFLRVSRKSMNTINAFVYEYAHE
jgi:hypothetical protein